MAKSPTIVSGGFRADRKYKVLIEMLGNHRGKLENGEPDYSEGGWPEGSVVTPAELGTNEAGTERLVRLGAIEPYVLMVPQDL